MNILVVDDDPRVRTFVAVVLQRTGYSVVQAESGEEGLEKSELIGEQLCLLLSDVTMPGMSGVELAMQIQQTSRVPIILMSGMNAPDQIAGTRIRFLAKPFKAEQLLSEVSIALSEPFTFGQTAGI